MRSTTVDRLSRARMNVDRGDWFAAAEALPNLIVAEDVTIQWRNTIDAEFARCGQYFIINSCNPTKVLSRPGDAISNSTRPKLTLSGAPPFTVPTMA